MLINCFCLERHIRPTIASWNDTKKLQWILGPPNCFQMFVRLETAEIGSCVEVNIQQAFRYNPIFFSMNTA